MVIAAPSLPHPTAHAPEPPAPTPKGYASRRPAHAVALAGAASPTPSHGAAALACRPRRSRGGTEPVLLPSSPAPPPDASGPCAPRPRRHHSCRGDVLGLRRLAHALRRLRSPLSPPWTTLARSPGPFWSSASTSVPMENSLI